MPNLLKNVKRASQKDLLALKEAILLEMPSLELRIEEARKKFEHKKLNSFQGDDSSDSESELCLLDHGPSLEQMQTQKTALQTRLQATQELSGVDVLQHEVTIMVNKPENCGSSVDKVTEDGVWREVTAECCADLVQFSIHFYTHKPNRKFAAKSYHGLQVVPLKAAQEVELSSSMLPGLDLPSDAVELVKSYAVAYRSRRSTLARLADKFGTALHMEPIPEGGYLLKCGGLLELSWTLQNKYSQLAPFHHKMKFEIEYMDEEHIRTITAAHRQLSEPAVDTNERTLLLAKIIDTCLTVARGQGVGETVKDESEIMAPPKTLPKKTKSKNKENSNSFTQKPVKRPKTTEENDNTTGKKRRTTDNIPQKVNVEATPDQNIDEGQEQIVKRVASDNNQSNVTNDKNKAKSTNENVVAVSSKKKKVPEKTIRNDGNVENPKKIKKVDADTNDINEGKEQRPKSVATDINKTKPAVTKNKIAQMDKNVEDKVKAIKSKSNTENKGDNVVSKKVAEKNVSSGTSVDNSKKSKKGEVTQNNSADGKEQKPKNSVIENKTKKPVTNIKNKNVDSEKNIKENKGGKVVKNADGGDAAASKQKHIENNLISETTVVNSKQTKKDVESKSVKSVPKQNDKRNSISSTKNNVDKKGEKQNIVRDKTNNTTRVVASSVNKNGSNNNTDKIAPKKSSENIKVVKKVNEDKVVNNTMKPDIKISAKTKDNVKNSDEKNKQTSKNIAKNTNDKDATNKVVKSQAVSRKPLQVQEKKTTDSTTQIKTTNMKKVSGNIGKENVQKKMKIAESTTNRNTTVIISPKSTNLKKIAAAKATVQKDSKIPRFKSSKPVISKPK